MNNVKDSFLYKKGYEEGLKAIPVINITINISNLDKVTETDRDLADALNTVENYKNMLFGKVGGKYG